MCLSGFADSPRPTLAVSNVFPQAGVPIGIVGLGVGYFSEARTYSSGTSETVFNLSHEHHQWTLTVSTNKDGQITDISRRNNCGGY